MHRPDASAAIEARLGPWPAAPGFVQRVARVPLNPALVLGAMLALAVVTRVVGLDLTLTADEGFWMQRTLRFGAAIERGDLRSTFRKGHPGVTVMWTGLAGIGRDRARTLFADRYQWPYVLERASAYGGMISSARLAVAVVASVLITIAIGLAWRLLGAGPAVVGGGLLLFDPYVTGMTRLLHVDALLAPLMTVAVLAALVYWSNDRTRWYLVLSGTATGLALLTKPPALVVGLMVGLLGLVTAWRRPRELRRILADLVFWGALVGLTYLACWPAMWVDPMGTARAVVEFVMLEGAQPHPGGVFFLGQSLYQDPGPFFYPVAFLLRLGLLSSVGLACLLLLSRAEHRIFAILALIGYALLFVVVMSFGAKKLDRYLLPALMVGDLLAGVGLWIAARWAGRAAPLALACCLATQIWLFTAGQPYLVAAYNPLMGGTSTAVQLMTVGWGEGLDQALAFLNHRRNASRLVVASNYHHIVRSQFRGTTHSLTRLDPLVTHVDYVVLYISTAQRGHLSQWAQQVVDAGPPVFTARVNGIPYAWVFSVPAGLERPTPTTPADDIGDDDEEP